MAEARGQFTEPEEMAYMALEDVPRGLVKIALPEKTKNLPY
jgi:hypothetical protein